MNLKGLRADQVKELVPGGVILLGYRGSVAHGTYTPSYGGSGHDDKDIIGVMIPELEHYFGLTQKEHYMKMLVGEDGVTWDGVVYEVRKYIRLLLKSNPNVMSLLWLPEHLYIYVSGAGQQIIDNRHIFVTKQAYHSFVGYAHGQLHRITHINIPGCSGKRKELVTKFGYDVKNAAHLIRLLRMGIEFLTDGELHVVRNDADELKEIKNGEWPLNRVLKEAERLFAMAQEAYIHSPLPPKPDRAKAEELLINILSDYFKEVGNC